jgi:hypothetical protein
MASMRVMSEPVAVAQAVARGVQDVVLRVNQARTGVGLERGVEVEDLLADGDVRVLERGDRGEEVPGGLVRLLLEHPAAARHIGARDHGRLRPVHVPAGDVELLEDVDVLAGHLGVADGEGCGRHTGDASTHDPQVRLLRINGLQIHGHGRSSHCVHVIACVLYDGSRGLLSRRPGAP